MQNNYLLRGKSLWLFAWLLTAAYLLPAQPTLVKDFMPGPGASYPGGLVNANGTLFLVTATPTPATFRLWRSNGTEAGTTPLKDFVVGPQGTGAPSRLTNVGGTVYFIANDGNTGTELWKSDGTPAGTVLVKDLSPGTFVLDGQTHPINTDFGAFTAVGGTLYFIAYDYNLQSDVLWKSDGTEAGTVPVKTGLVSSSFTRPALLSSGGETLYFLMGRDETELWKSDGTPGGTVLVKQLYPDDAYWQRSHFAVYTNGALYIGTSYATPPSRFGGMTRFFQLWRSNGTDAGTTLVGELATSEASGSYPEEDPSLMTSHAFVGNNLYFTIAGEGSHILYKSSLMAQVEELGSVGPGLFEFGSVYFSPDLTDVNGTLYLAADPADKGRELYKLDATGAISLVADLDPGSASSDLQFLTLVNGVLYFSAEIGTSGWELFRYDPQTCGGPAATFAAAGSAVCKGQQATVTVTNAKPGTTYTLYLNNTSFGQMQAGGSSVTFTVATDKLAPGSYIFTVQSFPCPQVLLQQTARIDVLNATGAAGPVVAGVTVYNGQPATLSVSEPLPGVTYRWYTQAAGGTAVATGTTYVTPALAATTTYYVSAAGDAGTSCGESSRTAVVVQVTPVATITGFTPGAVTAPDTVVVTGTTFVGVTAVKVGDVPVRFTVIDSLTLRLIVPENTPSGLVTVTTPAGTATSAAQLSVTTPFAIRINAGSRRYVAADGRVFAADRYFSGGQPSSVSNSLPDGTEDDSLYLQGRYGGNFSYNLPTGNGAFNVILHFRETYWGMDGRPGDVNSRRFNVDVEGTRRLTDYSIFAATGGQNTLVREAFRAVVTDGVLNLLFTRGSADLAYVSAIEVVPAENANVFRINAGGAAYLVSGDRFFLSDSYYKGGTVSTRGLDAGLVYNSPDWPLYWRGRFGSSFGYEIPAGNGAFEVILHFSEPYWGYLGGSDGGAGSRKFNVDIEGARKLTEFDIFAAAGGANLAVQRRFTVNVTDGVLNLLFSKGSADLAYVSAIEVVPAVNTWRINAGGPAYTTTTDKVFSADTYFTGGALTTPVVGEVSGTPESVLYQTGRFGNGFSYNVPTGDGTFDVVLHFNETYWGNLTGGGAGSRKFNVNIEGARRLTEYDIFARAGGAMRAVTETFRTTVSDGVLNIQFGKGSADFPRVSAIEVFHVPNAARIAAAGTDGAERTGVPVLYPNPVRDRLYVKLATPAAGVSATSVTTAGGQTLLVNPHRVSGEYELEIPVGGLRSGLYLLRLQTDQTQYVIRFNKQ